MDFLARKRTKPRRKKARKNLLERAPKGFYEHDKKGFSVLNSR